MSKKVTETPVLIGDDQPNKKQKKPRKQLTKNKPKTKSNGLNASNWFWFSVGSVIVMILAFVLIALFVPKSNQFVSNVGELSVLSQTIAIDAKNSTSEREEEAIDTAFSSLKNNQQRFNMLFDSVTKFRNSDAINKVEKDWKSSNDNITQILKKQDAIKALNNFGLNISEDIPEIQVHYNDAINQMLASGMSAQDTLLAKNQVILAERILRSVNSVASGDQGAFGSADDFNTDTQQFGQVLMGQLNGSPQLGIRKITNPAIRKKLLIIQQIYNDRLSVAVKEIFSRAQDIYSARENVTNVQLNQKNILQQLKTVDTDLSSERKVVLPSILFIASLFAGLIALYKQFQLRSQAEKKRSQEDSQRRLKEAEADVERAAKIQEENDRNQTAILRLLDELGDLADGDLTVNATVSEDFTGAIADSVNFAIDQLRQLVSAINRTAISVASSSDETQNTAMQLAESSEHQAQEIAGASAAINEMAVSIDQVSANAVESAAVADRSVAIAYNGAEVVQRTIDGMNTIREQIQETAKRIKRLGESSQEIGDIISLINDISDQTNILALNAAIQASTAGEAGRGFAVVADEVQRLAERSANATKQIESLVKTIQADTNEAVSSMEMTTAEVVKGAKLAKDAGEALEEVQTVSNTLSDLIQNISNAARQQAASAGHISNTMNIIQEITTQTTAGTIATARSVGQLNEMALALRESVSGFTLPDEEVAMQLS